VNRIPLQTSKLHREIENLPKVQSFLSSVRRNSIRTAIGYKTSLAYFQEFLSSQHNHTVESILDVFSEEKQVRDKRNSINVYEILERFITFMQEEKRKVTGASINQYLNGYN
jgi:hypothetical protein